jgi:hypothetical protein
MPLAAHTFANVKVGHLALVQLKGLLLALQRLAFAERMTVAQAEIERGRERLWLGPDEPPNKKKA